MGNHEVVTCWLFLMAMVYPCVTFNSRFCANLTYHSTKCTNYTNSVYTFPDQSSVIIMNVTRIVSGDFCRERAYEFICNYIFPLCENNLPVPICSKSCSEYLTSGICTEDLRRVLNLLIVEGYLNTSVDEIIKDNCSLSRNVPVSNDCTNLNAVPSRDDNVRCIPVPENEFCRNEMNFTDYAIDVATTQFNIDITTAFEGVVSRLQQSSGVIPFCSVIVKWATCLYKFPPCESFKLIIPCTHSCDALVVDYFGLCLRDILNHLNSETDRILQSHFPAFGCRDFNDYYADFKEQYFTASTCFVPIPTPNATYSSSSSNSQNSAVIIVPSVVSIILIVILIIVFAYIWRKRRKGKDFVVVLNRMMSNPNYDSGTMTVDHEYHSFPAKSLRKQYNRKRINSFVTKVTPPIFGEFEIQLVGHIIDSDNLTILAPIGQGAFGNVHKGLYTKDGETIDVAIKALKATSFAKTEEFVKECIVAKQFDHPNVLGLIGVSIIQSESLPLMILPYMHNGDVKSFLRSKRGGLIHMTDFPEGLSNKVLTKMCCDIAKGMDYLSSLHFVHRDLAARNCMLDKDMTVKVADFGFSRDVYVSDYYRLKQSTPLPVKWLAPESLYDKVFTPKSDVWSFGITCWEIFSLGLEPYPSVDVLQMTNYLKGGGTLDQPPLCSDEMYRIMKWCWRFLPQDRPTFLLLVQELD
ncbi:tyrosine-protein kinase receptor UFO-like isoform X2 [Dysidea avara]|uniref:tyrosine-protein kinase receptor UFO-like isoform X2 n=1 Tax=Dysidea avara TaxID=196820 RepID=UPI003317B35C